MENKTGECNLDLEDHNRTEKGRNRPQATPVKSITQREHQWNVIIRFGDVPYPRKPRLV